MNQFFKFIYIENYMVYLVYYIFNPYIFKLLINSVFHDLPNFVKTQHFNSNKKYTDLRFSFF